MVAVTAPMSTRERLLAAAVEVFVDQGYEQARLAEIARRAGLTTGAIYANFRGKAELLFEAIGARADTEIDAVLAAAHGTDVRALFEQLGDQLVQPRDNVPLLVDAIASARRDPELAAVLRERLGRREQRIAVLTDQAQHTGAVDGDLDSATFARFCMTLAMGALVLRTLQTPPPDGGEWHSLISRLLDAVSVPEDQ
ncbi:MAG TPA: TetR/AcrR family transcriptional regulator [Acidimicrobiia bacterium]|jgi:AcrR family transcriptional regulator